MALEVMAVLYCMKFQSPTLVPSVERHGTLGLVQMYCQMRTCLALVPMIKANGLIGTLAAEGPVNLNGRSQTAAIADDSTDDDEPAADAAGAAKKKQWCSYCKATGHRMRQCQAYKSHKAAKLQKATEQAAKVNAGKNAKRPNGGGPPKFPRKGA